MLSQIPCQQWPTTELIIREKEEAVVGEGAEEAAVAERKQPVRLLARNPRRVVEPVVLTGAVRIHVQYHNGRRLLLVHDAAEYEGSVNHVCGACSLYKKY
jgi:hypothetical protein